MTTKTSFAATIALAAMLAPAAAAAAPATYDADDNVAIVRTVDLDLTTAEGQSTLKARIASAVSHVCGTTSGIITMEERVVINTCRAKASSAAYAAAKLRQDQMLAGR